MKLSPRKFTIGESVWAHIKNNTYHATIHGYEDGRNLQRTQSKYQWNGPYPTWAYHVIICEPSGHSFHTIVSEEALRKVNQGHIHV